MEELQERRSQILPSRDKLSLSLSINPLSNGCAFIFATLYLAIYNQVTLVLSFTGSYLKDQMPMLQQGYKRRHDDQVGILTLANENNLFI